MIFEIEIQKDKNVSEYIDVLTELGNFVLNNNIVYLDTIKDISVVSQSLPIEKCQYITSSNYKSVTLPFCRKWCADILYKQELLAFEKTQECQERLRFINNQLDILEKGGGAVAQKVNKEKGKSSNRKSNNTSS